MCLMQTNGPNPIGGQSTVSGFSKQPNLTPETWRLKPPSPWNGCPGEEVDMDDQNCIAEVEAES